MVTACLVFVAAALGAEGHGTYALQLAQVPGPEVAGETLAPPPVPEPAGEPPASQLPGADPALVKPAEPVGGAPAVQPEPAMPPAGEPIQPSETIPPGVEPPGAVFGEVRLPERVSPEELNRLMTDLPGSFELVDIRPGEQFEDYHIQGSRNVSIGELVNNPVNLQGGTPVVIVDRDGSIAMAVGGILAQRTQRPVKVLHGGLEAYWEAFGLEGAAPPEDVAPAPPPSRTPAGSTPAPTAPARHSAGC